MPPNTMLCEGPWKCSDPQREVLVGVYKETRHTILEKVGNGLFYGLCQKKGCL